MNHRLIGRKVWICIISGNDRLIINRIYAFWYEYNTEKNILHNGDLTLKDVLECAKTMRGRSQARLFVGTVMEILGTAVSIGCTVEGQDPRVIQQKIKDGEIDIIEPESQ